MSLDHGVVWLIRGLPTKSSITSRVWGWITAWASPPLYLMLTTDCTRETNHRLHKESHAKPVRTDLQLTCDTFFLSELISLKWVHLLVNKTAWLETIQILASGTCPTTASVSVRTINNWKLYLLKSSAELMPMSKARLGDGPEHSGLYFWGLTSIRWAQWWLGPPSVC